MKLIGTSNIITTLAIGTGVVLLAPVVVGALGSVLRPVAKAAIKGSMIAFDKARETGAETMEALEDLASEAKSELAQQQNKGA
jgi:hypothetical protein